MPAQQLDLLAWTPPQPVARYDEHTVRAAGWAARLSRAVATTLRDSQQDRAEIARRMSEWSGQTITVNMLDAYASQAREQHVIPVPRLLALMHATGDRRLLELLAEPFGWTVIERRYLPLIEAAAIREREGELRRARKALTRRARQEGAL